MKTRWVLGCSLGLIGSLALGCAVSEEPVTHEERAAALWDSIEGFEQWPTDASTMLFVDGAADDVVRLWVLEDPDHDELLALQREDQQWFGARYTREGELLNTTEGSTHAPAWRASDPKNNEGVRQCVTCHLNVGEIDG